MNVQKLEINYKSNYPCDYSDVHGDQLFKQQMSRIWNKNVCKLSLALILTVLTQFYIINNCFICLSDYLHDHIIELARKPSLRDLTNLSAFIQNW